MKSYFTKDTLQSVLDVMNKFPDHDAWLVEVDNSSGIGSTITLTIDIIHNGVAGKFSIPVTDYDSW